jgi:cysteine-S-conjugate beta-lyase
MRPERAPVPGFDDLDIERLRAQPGIKWTTCEPDVLPAWVADMDYPLAPVVVEALRQLIENGDLGYPDWPDGSPLRPAFAARMRTRHAWAAEPDRVREHTHIIQALQIVLDLATTDGDAIAVQMPAYPPFLAALAAMRRRVLPLSWVDTPQGWRLDLSTLADAAARGQCRVLLLVNPHNPTGRVLTEAELDELAGIARRHGLLVISDEVHAELVYPPHRHTPFAALSPDAAACTVTLTSAAKAFNLAALRCAVAHYGPPALLARRDARPPDLYGGVSTLGVAATLAAWRDGDAWQADLLTVLARNRNRVVEHVAAHLPGVGHHPPEGTYLAWLDVRALRLGEPAQDRVLRRGRVRLQGGAGFGDGADGFLRLNFATSAGLLEDILAGLGRGLYDDRTVRDEVGTADAD